MKQGALRILQEELIRANRYSGPLNGQSNAALTAACTGLLEDRAADLAAPPDSWGHARRRVAAFQLVCLDRSFDPGPVDGLWGQMTETAYAGFSFFRKTGEMPVNYRDIAPLDVNPNGWPFDGGSQQELFDFFDFNPNHGGAPATVRVTCPWELKLAWDPSVKTRKIGCHPKVADSLTRVLEGIHRHYGETALEEMGLSLYGGCKNVRRKRGGSTWSTHSFAAAIDWDPDRNRLDWGWTRARMARHDFLQFWRCWEEEGWVSLGRMRNFDWMHVQAIKLR